MTATAWNAKDYARNSAGQARFAHELIDRLALRAGQSVLDIGCGDGKITREIARLVYPAQVVGIDSSAAMITFADNNHRTNNLNFFHMDAMAIDLTESFDVAFSNAVLHWVPDHIAVLRGVKRVLKPGGKILFQMGGAGNAADIIRVINEVTQQKSWREYFVDFKLPYYFYDISDYENFLSQGDFKKIRIELLDKEMQFENPEGLQGWLRSAWFPVTDCVPEERRQNLLSEIVSAYCQSCSIGMAKGSITVAMKRLEVEAVCS